MIRRDFIKKAGMLGVIVNILPSTLLAKKDIPIEVIKEFFSKCFQELEKDWASVRLIIISDENFKLFLKPLMEYEHPKNKVRQDSRFPYLWGARIEFWGLEKDIVSFSGEELNPYKEYDFANDNRYIFHEKSTKELKKYL